MFRRVCILGMGIFLWGLSNGAVLAKCLDTEEILEFAREHTLIGKSIPSGKSWKAYFRGGGPVTFQYSSGSTPTYRWFVKGGVILIKSKDGRTSFRRKICEKRSKYYWTDAGTGKASSRIIRSSRGDHLGARKRPRKPRVADTGQSVMPVPTGGQNNRFLVTKDFSANFNWQDAGNGYFIKGTATVSFYMKNVSNGGISVLVTPRQAMNFQVNHPLVFDCRESSFSGVPMYPRNTAVQDGHMRRIAVYIPKGEGLYVTAKKDKCKFAGQKSFYRGAIKNGVVSGNVTVIKGRRILTRPISGRF